MSTLERRKASAEQYLGQRTGKLEYRFLRYGAVADELFAMGMDDSSLLVDVGAGMCDFDFYLRTVRGWKGRYLPVDASIDGCDLEQGIALWARPDFITAIEVLEHLRAWQGLIEDMQVDARTGVVVTTPNTDTLGATVVHEMDPTHLSPLTQDDLEKQGFAVTVESFFGQPNDSLLGVWRNA